MKPLSGLLFVICAVVLLAPIGCDNSAKTRVPDPVEVEDAKARRLAEIEKLNIPEDQKERMRQQIQGGNPGAPPQSQGR